MTGDIASNNFFGGKPKRGAEEWVASVAGAPIKYLSEKIEHFEVSATQAQLLASTVAGVFENIVSAFTMTDYMISNVAVMVMAMVILAQGWAPWPMMPGPATSSHHFFQLNGGWVLLASAKLVFLSLC